MSSSVPSALLTGRVERQKQGALFWVENRGCFRFQCFNAGSYECAFPMEFPGFLERLNPGLFREYQRERFHLGMTGGRWNCVGPGGL